MKFLNLLFKALGTKGHTDDAEADRIAWIRVVILLQAVATNFFIIAGIIRHWG